MPLYFNVQYSLTKQCINNLLLQNQIEIKNYVAFFMYDLTLRRSRSIFINFNFVRSDKSFNLNVIFAKPTSTYNSVFHFNFSVQIDMNLTFLYLYVIRPQIWSLILKQFQFLVLFLLRLSLFQGTDEFHLYWKKTFKISGLTPSFFQKISAAYPWSYLWWISLID